MCVCVRGKVCYMCICTDNPPQFHLQLCDSCVMPHTHCISTHKSALHVHVRPILLANNGVCNTCMSNSLLTMESALHVHVYMYVQYSLLTMVSHTGVHLHQGLHMATGHSRTPRSCCTRCSKGWHRRFSCPALHCCSTPWRGRGDRRDACCLPGALVTNHRCCYHLIHTAWEGR